MWLRRIARGGMSPSEMRISTGSPSTPAGSNRRCITASAAASSRPTGSPPPWWTQEPDRRPGRAGAQACRAGDGSPAWCCLASRLSSAARSAPGRQRILEDPSSPLTPGTSSSSRSGKDSSVRAPVCPAGRTSLACAVDGGGHHDAGEPPLPVDAATPAAAQHRGGSKPAVWYTVPERRPQLGRVSRSAAPGRDFGIYPLL